jgi:Holliday junction DNA helicase RuvB
MNNELEPQHLYWIVLFIAMWMYLWAQDRTSRQPPPPPPPEKPKPPSPFKRYWGGPGLDEPGVPIRLLQDPEAVAVHEPPPIQPVGVVPGSPAEAAYGHLFRDVPPPDMDPPPRIYFKPGEPQTFDEFAGQPHVIEQLRDAIAALDEHEQAIAPQIFLGYAGSGKTLLAKIVARELQARAELLGQPPVRLLEVFPADIPTVQALDQVMRQVEAHPGTVVFIDEVHGLEGVHSHKLYEVLENGRYKFEDEPYPVELPPVTLVAATTDWGALHPALQRRWTQHQFKPASPDELRNFVRRRPFPITEPALEAIVRVTQLSGAPWEAIELYELARNAAKARRSTTIDTPDTERVFKLQEIDAQGLRWMDRKVIQVLLTQPKKNAKGMLMCYAASEANLCSLAGIDKEQYRTTIRPRLMSRGLLELRPYYGQALTAAAVATYQT